MDLCFCPKIRIKNQNKSRQLQEDCKQGFGGKTCYRPPGAAGSEEIGFKRDLRCESLRFASGNGERNAL